MNAVWPQGEEHACTQVATRRETTLDNTRIVEHINYGSLHVHMHKKIK